jgi:hypothetical protein
MAQNIYSLQLLRNGTPFTSYTDAVAAITGDTTRQDGIIKLARYTSNESDSATTKYNTSTVKTVFGIYYKPASGDGSWTLFDSYHEVIQNIQNQIDSLTGGAGSIAQQIEAALNQLNFTGVTGNVVTQVTQGNGLVAATGANVGTLELTGYEQGSDTDDVAATDTINQAFAKLQNQIDELSGSTDDAIEALDGSITAETGYYINKVDEVDGVISGTTAALPTVAAISSEGQAITAVSQSLGTVDASYGDIAAAHVTVADADGNLDATNVEDALAEIYSGYVAADQALKTEILGGASASADTLGELEALINNLEAGAATYSIRKDTESLPTNVKERYTLVETVNGANTDKQVSIDIYKDNTLKSVELVDQALQFTYIVDSGESVVSVDVSKFLAESEFASGVTVNSDGVAHGVVDPTSEGFLTVGENGFKLAGVQDAINAASGDVKSKLDELSGKTEALSAKTVTGIDMTGGTASLANNSDVTKKITINADGSTLSASTNYASAATASAVAAGDSIDTALGKLEAQVAAAKAAATTKVEKDANASHITMTSNTAADGSVTYIIGEDDIASASALTAEIAARKAVDGQNGDTYAANASANYISGATSLNDADVKLDAAIKALEGAAQTEIDAIEEAIGLTSDGAYSANTTNNYTSAATSVNGAIDALDDAVKANEDDIAELSGKSVTSVTVNGVEVASNNVASIVLDYTNEAANSENGMVITTNENTGAMDIKFGTLDCGEYN